MFFKRKKNKTAHDAATSLFMESQRFPVQEALESAMSMDFGLKEESPVPADPRQAIREESSTMQMLGSLESSASNFLTETQETESPVIHSKPITMSQLPQSDNAVVELPPPVAEEPVPPEIVLEEQLQELVQTSVGEDIPEEPLPVMPEEETVTASLSLADLSEMVSDENVGSEEEISEIPQLIPSKVTSIKGKRKKSAESPSALPAIPTLVAKTKSLVMEQEENPEIPLVAPAALQATSQNEGAFESFVRSLLEEARHEAIGFHISDKNQVVIPAKSLEAAPSPVLEEMMQSVIVNPPTETVFKTEVSSPLSESEATEVFEASAVDEIVFESFISEAKTVSLPEKELVSVAASTDSRDNYVVDSLATGSFSPPLQSASTKTRIVPLGGLPKEQSFVRVQSPGKRHGQPGKIRTLPLFTDYPPGRPTLPEQLSEQPVVDTFHQEISELEIEADHRFEDTTEEQVLSSFVDTEITTTQSPQDVEVSDFDFDFSLDVADTLDINLMDDTDTLMESRIRQALPSDVLVDVVPEISKEALYQHLQPDEEIPAGEERLALGPLDGIDILAASTLAEEFQLLLIHHEGIYALMMDNGEHAALLKSFDSNPIAHNHQFIVTEETVLANKVMYIVQVGDWQGIIALESDEAKLQAEIG